jgi:hypothetical protein
MLFLVYYVVSLQEHEQILKDSEKEQLSSLVWICTSTSTESRVVVIDANSPGDILETFRVSTASILCIASISGMLWHHCHQCFTFRVSTASILCIASISGMLWHHCQQCFTFMVSTASILCIASISGMLWHHCQQCFTFRVSTASILCITSIAGMLWHHCQQWRNT